MTRDQIQALQRAMLSVPGVTLQSGADGLWGRESAAAFALIVAKAGGQPVTMVRSMDEVLFNDLKRFEGLRLSPYLDTEGVPTIGYGHTGPDVTMQSAPITRDRAEYLLVQDIDEHDTKLYNALPWITELDPVRQMVLRNMAFNMGVGWPPSPGVKGKGLRSFVNTLEYVRTGQYDKAADGMLSSQWARQVGPNRSGYLADAMRTGRV